MKPQRIVFLGLLGGCALLAAGWVALLAGVGQGVEPTAPRDANGQLGEATAVEEDFALPGFESYAEVMNRPLFNEDRRPLVEATELDTDEPTEEQQAEVALNVTVTGIIITPGQKLAMVTNNVSRELLRLKEGMQLDGDQASWTLSTIEPRRLVFDGGSQGTAEVKLETFTQPLKGGAPPPARRTAAATAASKQENNNQTAAPASADADAERAARAEEIRRRVAERRAELRAEADRRRAEAEQDDDG